MRFLRRIGFPWAQAGNDCCSCLAGTVYKFVFGASDSICRKEFQFMDLFLSASSADSE